MNNIQKRDQLGVIKTFTKAAFEAEPEDVRTAIFAQASALKTENTARKAQARNSEPDISPQGYAIAIESVASVLDAFIRDLAIRTGWAFSVMGGGPDPVNGGRIQTISFHEGRNSLGATFKKAHVSFEQSVLKPYAEFLNQVYPLGVCEARALVNRVDEPSFDNPSSTAVEPALDTTSLATAAEHDMAQGLVGDEAPVTSGGPNTNQGHDAPSPAASSTRDEETLYMARGSVGGEPPVTSSGPDTNQGHHAPSPAASNTRDEETLYIAQGSVGGEAPVTSRGPDTNQGHHAPSPAASNTRDEEMFYIDPRLRPSPSLSPTSSSEVPTAPFGTQTHGASQFDFPATYTFAPPAAIGAVLATSQAPELPGAPLITPPFAPTATASARLISAGPDQPSAPVAIQKARARKAPAKKKPKKASGPLLGSAAAVKATAADEAAAERLMTERAAVVAAAEKIAAAVGVADTEVTKTKVKAKAKTTKVNAKKVSTPISDASDASNLPQAPTALQSQRLQQVRIPAISKEVVPLTSRKRDATKENDSEKFRGP